MRTKSIISIIRRYGLNSRRLSPKNRIKYAEAVASLKSYQNSELSIVDVIDNQWHPHLSRSHICQVPGCGMHIRYEYVLRNKEDNSEFVAGSTCVWVLLGLSELEIKNFKGLEEAIKEHRDLEVWKQANPDIIEKLEKAKLHNMVKFGPFWREIENCRLTDEDTEYMKSVSIDAILEAEAKRAEEKAKRIEEAKKAEALKVSVPNISEVEYDRVVKCLDELSNKFPTNSFFDSLKAQISYGKVLSLKQVQAIKASYNRTWYDEHVKGTAQDMWSSCESFVIPYFVKVLGIDTSKLSVEGVLMSKDLKELNTLVKEDTNLTEANRNAWATFKVKYRMVL